MSSPPGHDATAQNQAHPALPLLVGVLLGPTQNRQRSRTFENANSATFTVEVREHRVYVRDFDALRRSAGGSKARFEAYRLTARPRPVGSASSDALALTVRGVL